VPTVPGNPSEFLLVTYRVSGGFTGYGTQLDIGGGGEVIAWSLGEAREFIGQRQLSAAELRELDHLLEPFSEYEDHYGRVVADGLAISITTKVDGGQKTVVVYSSADAEPPPGWTELEAKLREVLESVRFGG
jgi:hypothetical protein